MEEVTETRLTKSGKMKWRPKKWLPEYNRIVAYSVLGKSNLEIAELTNFTKEHVSTILNCPQALKLKEELGDRLVRKIEENVPDVLAELSTKATKRVKEVLDNDELVKKSPFAVAGLAMDILKGQGHMRGGGNGAPVPNGPTTNNFNTVVVTEAQRGSIMDGLNMIKEVRQLHSPVDDNRTP